MIMTATRLRPVIENLIVAQRALDRAVHAKKDDARKLAVGERDRCAVAIEDAFRALELATNAAVDEQKRLENRELNLRLILSRIDRDRPDIVGEGIEAALLRLETDPRMGEAFLACLNEAIEDGHAVRKSPEDVRITYAGILQLLSAKRLRGQLTDERTRAFKLEQRARAAEAIVAAQAPSNQPRKAAVGA